MDGADKCRNGPIQTFEFVSNEMFWLNFHSKLRKMAKAQKNYIYRQRKIDLKYRTCSNGGRTHKLCNYAFCLMILFPVLFFFFSFFILMDAPFLVLRSAQTKSLIGCIEWYQKRLVSIIWFQFNRDLFIFSVYEIVRCSWSANEGNLLLFFIHWSRHWLAVGHKSQIFTRISACAVCICISIKSA